MSFSDFAAMGCLEPFLSALAKRGFKNPTPVQMDTFQPAINNRDLLVQSCTGSGKTLAFGLPILHKIKHNNYPQALILTPTRELAQQINDELKSIENNLTIALLVGGLSYTPQLKALHNGSKIIIGTPGRIQDHINRGTLNLSKISMTVLDECDEMLNMGFIDSVEKILSNISEVTQLFLFSATLPTPIERLANKILKNPHHVNHGKTSGSSQHTDITHTPCIVDEKFHTQALINFLLADEPSSALIFAKMKISTELITQSLKDTGLAADCLHGDLSQHTRNNTLQSFKNGKLRYLVATDVAARGIDIEKMPLVIHMGIPSQLENYIHRSGRTGRAGAKGFSLAIVNSKEARMLKHWSQYNGLILQWRKIPNQNDIKKAKIERLIQSLHTIPKQDINHLLEISQNMLTNNNATFLVASLIHKIINNQYGFEIPIINKSNNKSLIKRPNNSKHNLIFTTKYKSSNNQKNNKTNKTNTTLYRSDLSKKSVNIKNDKRHRQKKIR